MVWLPLNPSPRSREAFLVSCLLLGNLPLVESPAKLPGLLSSARDQLPVWSSTDPLAQGMLFLLIPHALAEASPASLPRALRVCGTASPCC